MTPATEPRQLGLPGVDTESRPAREGGAAPRTLVEVVCKLIRRRLRMRPVSAGYEPWNVAFPRALRVEGARFAVERLEPTTRKYYRAVGAIWRL